MPNLDHPLFCRIIFILIIFSLSIVPLCVVSSLTFLPTPLLPIICIIYVAFYLFIFFKKLEVIFAVDSILAIMQCFTTSRLYFKLPEHFSAEYIEKKITHFGKRVNTETSLTGYIRMKIKKTSNAFFGSNSYILYVAMLRKEIIDVDQYNKTVTSLSKLANSQIKFKNDNYKKNVTVILIIADKVSDQLRSVLYDTIRKNSGDGFDISILPCIVDMENRTCTFDSERIPWLLFDYPIKNKGIRFIRRLIFKGSLTLSESPKESNAFLEKYKQYSLWKLWKEIKNDFSLHGK